MPLQLELRVRRGDLRGAAQAAQRSEDASVLEVALAVLTGGLPELGRALERYAPTLTVPRERAALLAGAARAFRTASLPIDARRAAEAALRLDSREARGAIELAELAAGSGADAVGPALASLALERALGLVGARGRWSLALAALAERDEELTLAAAWTRRAWALRPADPEVATAWLRRAVALGDLDLCAEVLETVARSVARLSAIAEPLAHTLRRLASDPEGREAYSAAARLLLSLGAARYPAIFTALRENAATHPDLAIAALERWIASSAPVSERGPALLEIAQIAREAGSAGGDESRAVEALARLLEDPDAPRALREEARQELLTLESTPLDPDAELLVRGVVADARLGKASEGLATARRGRLAPELEADVDAAANALRRLGRDLWDLAEDPDAARRAWLRGARLLGAEGLDRLAADLRAFGGDAQARDAVYELARLQAFPDDDRLPPNVFQRVHDQQLRLRAFECAVAAPPDWVEPTSLAREAVAHAPDPAAVLPGVEMLVRRIGRVDTLPEIFELAAGRSAGRFAERGVRHHAARVLERLGLPLDALHHAVRAFAAQPTEGSALRSLERLAIATRRQDLATAVLVEAAEQATEAERKAMFFDRAVSLGKEAPPEERLDLLLRLFLIAPSPKTVAAIAETIRIVAAEDEALRASETERLLRAHKKVDGKLGYTDRLPVLSAVARAVADLRGVGAALALVAKGEKSTPRGDLGPLREVAEQIGRLDPEGARAWLAATTPAEGGPADGESCAPTWRGPSVTPTSPSSSS
ncbi:MAG: hypothetical protein IPJ34_36335 [Myxococcales bacterium]|nr:hypothetical protein [Myxococcales bacterium]